MLLFKFRCHTKFHARWNARSLIWVLPEVSLKTRYQVPDTGLNTLSWMDTGKQESFFGGWENKLSCCTAKGFYIFPTDLSTSDWGTVWQQKEILLIHTFAANKYVTGFSCFDTDQFSQECPSWEYRACFKRTRSHPRSCLALVTQNTS